MSVSRVLRNLTLQRDCKVHAHDARICRSTPDPPTFVFVRAYMRAYACARNFPSCTNHGKSSRQCVISVIQRVLPYNENMRGATFVP